MRLNNTHAKFSCLMAMLFCIQASGQSVNFTMGTNGLTSLTYGGKQLLSSSPSLSSSGIFLPSSARFKNSSGTSSTAYPGTSYSVDLAKNIVTNTNAKFVIQCQYVKISDTRLDLKVVVKNTSTDTLTGAGGRFLVLTSDSAVMYIGSSCNWISCAPGAGPGSVSVQGTGGWDNNDDGGPQISFFSLGSACNVAVCNMSNPEQGHSWWVMRNSSANVLTFTFNLSSGSVAPNRYSDTCNISFRFDAPGKLTFPRLSSLCEDAAMRYGGSFPSKVNWPDRRPMGECVLSSYADGGPTPTTNPSRWGQGAPLTTINVTTTAGKENFRSWVLGWINSCINTTRKMNGQAIITWDVEGSKYAFDYTTFTGDPTMATTMAPEWNYKGTHDSTIIDDFFKAQRDAGLIPGLCIRPQKFVITNGVSVQEEVFRDESNGVNPGNEIFEKVDYAYKRWGVRIFYIDSNIYTDYTTILSKDLMQKTLAAHPDVLLLGEWQTFNYFQFGSVYENSEPVGGDGSSNGTALAVKLIYPDATSLIYLSGDPLQPIPPISKFISSARKGDMYLAYSWFKPSGIDSICKINTLLSARPYNVKLNVPSSGGKVATSFFMTATASDSGANPGIDSVEFLSSGIKIGVAKTSPYSFTWTNALSGKHSLYARAVDKLKNTACSQPVNVVVDPGTIQGVIKGSMFISSLKGPISVSVYSLNGRLIRKLDSKDPTRLLTPVVLRGLSSGIYIMKIKHANGAIDKRKMEVVW